MAPKRKRSAEKSTAQRFASVYKRIPDLLMYLALTFKIISANTIPEVDTLEFYQRYGFQILRKPGSTVNIPSSESCEFWKTHMNTHGNNIRVTRKDTRTQESLSGRKYIFPFDNPEKTMKISEPYEMKLEQEREHLKSYFESIKEYIGIVGHSIYEAWETLLYSLPGGPTQEFHYDIDSDDPNTYVLWIPFEEDTTIWIIPGSHIPIKELNLSGEERKVLSKDFSLSELLNEQIPIQLQVQPGDILKMHARLIHAGNTYSKTNLRAHFYVETSADFNGANNLKNIYPAELFGKFTVLHYLENCSRTLPAIVAKKIKPILIKEKLCKARGAKATKKQRTASETCTGI